MAIFTNHERFGGPFLSHLERMLDVSSDVRIAVGYTGAEAVERISPKAEGLCERGGVFKLLVGTPFFEGLSRINYQFLSALHGKVSSLNAQNGVFLSINTLFHGKIYLFSSGKPSILAGSSNLSLAGLSGNYEFVSTVGNDDFTLARRYLDFLMSDSESAPLDRIEGLTIFDSPEYKKIRAPHSSGLRRYSGGRVRPSERFVEIPFGDMDEKLRSGLNAYFGKGRKRGNKVKVRPWFEVEVIAPSSVTEREDYPKGEFTVITDDGFTFECKTSGDYHKNFRSKGDLQILGRWIKGKLQNKGVLAPLSPVTNETLLRYGAKALRLYPLGGNRYYLKF
jgi:hypothetical protein